MSDKQFNINRHVGTITIPTSDTISAGTVSALINGVTSQIQFVVPTTEDTDTVEFKIQNSADREIFASGEKAESSTNIMNVERALQGTIDFVAEAQGTQSAAIDLVFEVYYAT